MTLPPPTQRFLSLQAQGAMQSVHLSALVEQHRFLRAVCTFHSQSENESMLPVVTRLAADHVEIAASVKRCEEEHILEAANFDALGRLLVDVRSCTRRGGKEATELALELCKSAEAVRYMRAALLATIQPPPPRALLSQASLTGWPGVLAGWRLTRTCTWRRRSCCQCSPSTARATSSASSCGTPFAQCRCGCWSECSRGCPARCEQQSTPPPPPPLFPRLLQPQDMSAHCVDAVTPSSCACSTSTCLTCALYVMRELPALPPDPPGPVSPPGPPQQAFGSALPPHCSGERGGVRRNAGNNAAGGRCGR